MATCDKEQLLATLEATNKRLLFGTLEQLEVEELKKFKWNLNLYVLDGFCPIPRSKLENADRLDIVDKMVQTYNPDGALKISLEILKKINQNNLAEQLERKYQTGVSGAEEASEKSSTSCLPKEDQVSPPQSSNITETGGHAAAPAHPGGNSTEDGPSGKALISYQQTVQSNLKDTYECVIEDFAKIKKLLDDIYTELYIIEGEFGELSRAHEVIQMAAASRTSARLEVPIKCNDIFKDGKRRRMRTVLTKGVAGIGKTFAVQRFIQQWAEGKVNQDIHFIFPLQFRRLNLLKGEKYKLAELLHECIWETKDIKKEDLNRIFTKLQQSGNKNYEKSPYKILFVLDGLDECRLELQYRADNTKSCDDVTQPTSVDVLLSNLIKGCLLPAARLWITSRPAATNEIPSECVDLVTEIRGFNDVQKEEYFKKRIPNKNMACTIISHIKASRSLYIMCQIPVFSCIAATVLEHMLSAEKMREIPKTLTEMYTNLLMLQTKKKNVKYFGETETDQHWDEKTIQSIQSLGKLAFQQLLKGNMIFYEKDLRECGIDVHEASVYSGVFTQIFREERDVLREKTYSFVHLSIQEFLAAVFVFLSFINNNENLMAGPPSNFRKLKSLFRKIPAIKLHKCAVDKALQSHDGHLDLFLRFLLGLSLESNQSLLRCLLTHTGSSSQSHEQTVNYIKEKIRENPSPERCINLFHCLNEMNDHSLVDEIQHYMSSASPSGEDLSGTQWSALVFMLLTSEEETDVFDLRKYSRSEKGLLKLLPVLVEKAPSIVLLSGCGITEKGCSSLASALSSNISYLRELDLSYNQPGDSGVKLLSDVLADPHCRLETLRLSGCKITEEGCSSLASALSPSHLRELDLSYNHPGDSGVKLLSDLLINPHCRLETLRMNHCRLTETGCTLLASAISSNSTHLRELDVSINDLQDLGVKRLSTGLGNPHCKLETLRLSECEVTEEGFVSLATALRSNPSHLRELDLSYNHPGESGVKLLSAGLTDPHWRLEKLNVDHREEFRIRRYACDLTMDPNTAHRELSLSEENRKVTWSTAGQPYPPDHPERFKDHPQVLCGEGLSGRCYWEVEGSGFGVNIAVTYKGISRISDRSRDDCQLGSNSKSWSLDCNDEMYSAYHNNKETSIHFCPSRSLRVGVYLDWLAGTLSFYSVSSDTLTHLHTFHTTFTEPLYPGFGLGLGSSLSLCQVESGVS